MEEPASGYIDNHLPTGTVAISGTAIQGQILTASNNLADADGMGTISYQWLANGAAISGATGSSLTLGQAQVGKAISVVASYTDSLGTSESVTSAASTAVANLNDAPTGSVTVSGTAKVGQTLSVGNTLADADGMGTISYQWLADGAAIGGATGASFTLGQTQAGKAISVTASYTDGFGTLEAVSSTSISVEQAVVGVTLAQAQVVEGGDLVYTFTRTGDLSAALTVNLGVSGTATAADYTSTLALSGSGSPTVQWTRMVGGAGNDIGYSIATGADGSVYIAGYISSDSIDGQTGNGGFDGFVTKYNADGTKAWTRLAGGAGDDIGYSIATGADGSVYIAGYTNGSIDGQANAGAWDGFVTKFSDAPAHPQVTFAAGSATATLTVHATADQVSEGPETLTVSVAAGDGYTLGSTAVATGTIIDVPVNNRPTGTVTITGTPKLGQALTASNTLADADGMGTISYQWFTGGQAIAGATQSSFSITQAQLGKELSVVASYTDGGGTQESVTSSAPVQVVSYNTSAAENTTAITTLAVTDAQLGTTPKYALTGADASLFKISSKGALTFAAAKDYEQPVDTNHDGIYEVSVTMTNAKTHYALTKDFTVGVEFAPILGTASADTLKGTAGYDTLDGKAGDDKLTGGAGLDTFLVTSGHDTITDFNLLTKGASGSEILQVAAGATADATLKAAWTATSDSFNDGTANILTSGMAVDLSAVSYGQGWSVTNKGAAAILIGSQFNDILDGGTGSDQLLGGAGNDLLTGGKGADILTGGAGNDTFRLSGDTKTDHITDFISGTDRIELDNALFKALLTEGQLAADQFAQGTVATTATQRIVYDQPKGNLWYNADGSGKGKAVLIGVLDNHQTLTYADLAVI